MREDRAEDRTNSEEDGHNLKARTEQSKQHCVQEGGHAGRAVAMKACLLDRVVIDPRECPRLVDGVAPRLALWTQSQCLVSSAI